MLYTCIKYDSSSLSHPTFLCSVQFCFPCMFWSLVLWRFYASPIKQCHGTCICVRVHTCQNILCWLVLNVAVLAQSLRPLLAIRFYKMPVCLHNLRKPVYKNELHQMLISVLKDENAYIDLPAITYKTANYQSLSLTRNPVLPVLCNS